MTTARAAARSKKLTLAQWLSWQHTLSPSEIDLGLDRVKVVAQRLDLERPPYRILTVGGTNGKGSAVAYLGAILRAAGWRTGAYTSPHLLHYRERISIAGVPVDDQSLCEAFAQVEAARAEIPLTFFEFGTLAAMAIFRQQQIAVAVLEVGLGGRLDAVNAFPSDGALVTSVGIDHTEWLGKERETIGWEKAGIYRSACPAICADRDPPQRLIAQAEMIGAELMLTGRDYSYESYTGEHHTEHWHWQTATRQLDALPLPALLGAYQLDNAAGAIALLNALDEIFQIDSSAIRTGLQAARLPGRMDQRHWQGIELILDVAHNPQAAMALADALQASQQSPSGQTRLVLGMLADKDCAGVAQALASVVDVWHLIDLEKETTRGQSAQGLREALQTVGIIDMIYLHSDAATAIAVALKASQAGDRLLICGSFVTVAAALRCEQLEELYRGSST